MAVPLRIRPFSVSVCSHLWLPSPPLVPVAAKLGCPHPFLYSMNRLLPLLFALLLAIPLAAQQQAVPFNGIVSDISGTPIKGARIYISKGRVARSDKQGRFGLTDVAATDTIHIYFKKRTYDIPVEGRKSLRVRLGDQLQAQEDQELVNWGYGFVKKRESLEISNGISGEDLVRSGYTNITMALQGRVPGLVVNQTGRPGQDAELNIRGTNSFYADQTPLFVVDGMIVESLDFISVYDVDHIEVLKEASIYGSRGANGAILVTTKRGPK